MKSDAVLQVKNLATVFETEEGRVRAVEDVGFSVTAGQTLGIVGESGCGKSVTALSIMRLLPKPSGIIEKGQILFRGMDILRLPADRLHKIRGNRISMIFQEPMTALNPVQKIGKQLKEVFSEEEIREYYRMRPGITGAGSLWYHHEDVLLAQVSDPYKFYRKVVMPRKMELERAYAEKWSLWLDAKILLMTLLVLSISRVGVIDSKNLFYRCFEKVFREF